MLCGGTVALLIGVLFMAEIGILDTIQKEIENERGKIIQAASRQAEDILQKARQEVERLKDAFARKTGKGKGGGLGRTSPVILRAKQDGMAQAFAGALDQLKQLRSKPEYPVVLKKLMQEACSGLSGDLEIQVNPADVGLAEKLAAELRISGRVVGKDEISGGVVLVQEGKIFNRNTFESRLAMVQNLLSGKVATILYG